MSNVTIRTRSVGVNFGTVGQVVARNGHVLHETDTKPYQFFTAATNAAEAWAEAHGHAIAQPAEESED